ncbi:hypothetical protein OO007_08860 [Cocleimonas sp. KMM 6892]|jgi:hypothetical protein|uniref:hypothetical protein n=1 Tax=unclassified Cocleimonas TaxID=2639732 RepID=UPI002DB9D3F7|nr:MULTISPECIES: hypothetical protein [unclassified Cocleimonas]MEB8432333.1 hypothetical protein [Cocleimonas sp. KMM 6892]MEC4714581.1 hypothetical protein [Cocleimonas sp. KMM 6895]MEC4744605.1 hypothetical protein [Cocleimonas sp. KMM 6896]
MQYTVFISWLKSLVIEIFAITYNLFKLMIPIIIVVKIIEELGGIEYIGIILEPIMQMVGLPASMGLVWATTLISNIYGGMIIYVTMPIEQPLTVAQVTVLGAMMLYAHALPIELRIAQKAGVRVIYLLLLRVGGALLLGFICHKVYSLGGYLDTPSTSLFNPEVSTDDSLMGWLMLQLETLFKVFLVISALVIFLRLLKSSGIEKLMSWLLKPVLKLLGLGEKTTSITIIGITLGVVYGGSLLINEAKSGRISKMDIFGSLTLLALCHSIIEDTLLIMLLGADITGALYFRVLFALLLTAILVRLAKAISDKTFNKYLVYPEPT